MGILEMSFEQVFALGREGSAPLARVCASLSPSLDFLGQTAVSLVDPKVFFRAKVFATRACEGLLLAFGMAPLVSLEVRPPPECFLARLARKIRREVMARKC